MKILALEFSSEQRSAAIVQSAGKLATVCGEASERGGRNANAFALVEEVLRQANMERHEIDCIAVGLGPGSYTGVRAAIALAQGWQLARDVKLLGVSSVKCVAERVFAIEARGRINVIVDAQRNEFYLASFELDESGIREVGPLHITTLSEIEKRVAEKQKIVGPDANRICFQAQNLFPDAGTLGKIAAMKTDFVAGEQLEPIYLRETSFAKAPPARLIADP